jgi:hypothetical protein
MSRWARALGLQWISGFDHPASPAVRPTCDGGQERSSAATAPGCAAAAPERSGHGLAERDPVEELAFAQPAAAFDQVPLHVPDGGDGSAEPSRAQSQEITQKRTEPASASLVGLVVVPVGSRARCIILPGRWGRAA